MKPDKYIDENDRVIGEVNKTMRARKIQSDKYPLCKHCNFPLTTRTQISFGSHVDCGIDK